MGIKRRYLPCGCDERLRDMIYSSGLSQRQIAERIGIDRKTVSKWLTGEFYPSLPVFIKLCSLFHVSADYILFGKEAQNEDSGDQM